MYTYPLSFRGRARRVKAPSICDCKYKCVIGNEKGKEFPVF